jgi:fructuronate reductase
MERLTQATAGGLPASIQVSPLLAARTANRGLAAGAVCAVGVVHLGLGGFHRAHQALVFEQLMGQPGTPWGVLGVAMRSTAVADVLAAQDGLYAVSTSHSEGRRWQVVSSLLATCVAAREPQRVIAALAAPTTRWVTLTVTEKGYGPELAALVNAGLDARRRQGLGGLTLASCDNLSHNGAALQRLCTEHARPSDPALADWIATHCAFPSSMVDRIVPTPTAQTRLDAAQALGLQDDCALATEAFWEWVIEDRFVDPNDANALRSAGVQVVADVSAYETAKLRMLNGSHSAIAVIGAVLGLATVDQCIRQPHIHAFIHRLMTQELMPALTRPALPDYRDALLQRFANPALGHRVHQIATDSSLKIPQRWMPAALAALQRGRPVECLAFAAAAWMRYCQELDDSGAGYAMNDPMAAALRHTAEWSAGLSPAVAAQAFLAHVGIWGHELAASTLWQQRVAHWLGRIRAAGMAASLGEVVQT